MAYQWEREPIADSPLSVVLTLADGNGQELSKTLASIRTATTQRKRPLEVLIPCPPNRAEELRSAIAQFPEARVVEDEQAAKGPGAALRAGIGAAAHPLIFTLAVGYDGAVIPHFLKEIDQVDIVCGARKGKQQRWRLRQFFSVNYQIFGIWLSDPECPVKLYRRTVFDHLPIQSAGPFAQVEILAKANFQSCLLTEVAIEGPTSDPPGVRGDLRRVMYHPDFGPPPAKQGTEAAKPILSTSAPESGAPTGQLS